MNTQLPASPAPAEPRLRGPYRPPSPRPTQDGPAGLRFDFNLGARVQVPAGAWRIQFTDLESGQTITNESADDEMVLSPQRYFQRLSISVSQDGVEIFRHDYDAAGQNVLIQFPVGSLGDVIGWMPYAARFAAQHRCNLTCAMGEALIPLFESSYPDIRFVPQHAVEAQQMAGAFYATYYIGLFFDDTARIWRPTEFRQVGLHELAGYILGVSPHEERPRIALADDTRPMAERYVAIAVQSSNLAKYWNNPTGWRDLVAFLRQAGYRVVCLDKYDTYGERMVWRHIPWGADDETGNRPLLERARWLKHADFFIGLSSGLAWLAWAMNTPVVMISGFSHPITEFDTPYRIINYTVCNSCWNDPAFMFPHRDFFWCPRLIGTDREWECSKQISAQQVINTVRRIPGFGQHTPAPAG